MTVRIGLTGPIGCGKSTIARWLAERDDVRVVDADEVARTVLEPGTAELEAVLARFGRDLLRPDGTLDRGALGRIVFDDPAALRDLEAIVHPAVRPRILAEMAMAEADGSAAVVVEAIKLVEGGLADLCDEVWLVTCDPSVQRERLLARGADPADAEARMAAQADLAERVRLQATRTIDAGQAWPATAASVEAALRDALAAAERSG